MEYSIIIATYNRCEQLETTLASIAKLNTGDLHYEIIVVDNNSSDKTIDTVNTFRDVLPLKYLFEPKQGKNHAVNKGIKFSMGEVLVFIDDDVTISQCWFKSVSESIKKNPQVDIFGGKILTKWPDKTPGWVFYSSSCFPFLFCNHDLGVHERYYSAAPLPAGANFWLRKPLLKKHNATFDTRFGPTGKRRVAGSETEFLRRMYNGGVKMLYVPGATVYHRVLSYEFGIYCLIHRFYATGKSAGILSTKNAAKRELFNIPLYVIKQIIEEVVLFIGYLLLLNKKKYMNSLIKIAYFYGKIKGLSSVNKL